MQFWKFQEQEIWRKEIFTLMIDLNFLKRGIRFICIVTKIHISVFCCIFVAAMQCSHEVICWFVIFIEAIQSTTLNHFNIKKALSWKTWVRTWVSTSSVTDATIVITETTSTDQRPFSSCISYIIFRMRFGPYLVLIWP